MILWAYPDKAEICIGRMRGKLQGECVGEQLSFTGFDFSTVDRMDDTNEGAPEMMICIFNIHSLANIPPLEMGIFSSAYSSQQFFVKI